MRKANLSELKEDSWPSPMGKFNSFGATLNDAIGGDAKSTDPSKRHPFEVEIARILPGAWNYPYHWHSAQWEFYLVLSGSGVIRDAEGTTIVGPGDFFMFAPGEAHQIGNARADTDFLYYVIANNTISDHCYYPDSDKWAVGIPGARKVIKGSEVEYLHGEDAPPMMPGQPT